MNLNQRRILQFEALLIYLCILAVWVHGSRHTMDTFFLFLLSSNKQTNANKIVYFTNVFSSIRAFNANSHFPLMMEYILYVDCTFKVQTLVCTPTLQMVLQMNDSLWTWTLDIFIIGVNYQFMGRAAVQQKIQLCLTV